MAAGSRWFEEIRMPLRCVDDRGTSIEAPEHTPEEWATLKEERRIRRHLTMPCCEAQAIPKTSKRGTQFFAHNARRNCQWRSETEEHLYLKALAVRIARSHGWDAQTEVSGTTPYREKWIADVLAQKGEERIAIEVQWSGQVNEETLRRQRKYAESGVKGIWLLRQPGFPVSPDLPAACIGGSLEDGLKLLLPDREDMTVSSRIKQTDWSQILAPETFISAVFEDHFLFDIPYGAKAKLSIIAAPNDCLACGRRMYMVMRLKGNSGPYGIHLYGDQRPQNLACRYPYIREKIKNALSHRKDIAKVDCTHGVLFTYIKGRCPKCHVWTRGTREHYLHEWSETVGTIELEMAGRWVREVWYNPHWAVWSPPSGTFPESSNNKAHTGCD